MTTLFDTSSMPQQHEFMASTADELLYSGAFGAGKTRVGCEKGLFLSLRYNNNSGAIVRKNFNHLRDSTMKTFFRYVIPEDLLARSSFNRNTSWLTLPNKSQILFGGIDQPGRFASAEFGWIFVDEAIELTEEDWIMLGGRLRLPGIPIYQLFGATNPGPQTHHLYRRFWIDGMGHKIEAKTSDNKYLPQSYLDRLDRFTGRYKERYVEGKWIGFEGLVYDNFDPSIHIVDPFHIPKTWERWRSIDFGFTNPFVCQWWAREPIKTQSEEDKLAEKPLPIRPLYRYREVYKSQTTIDIHLQTIAKHSGLEVYRNTIADWDSGDRMVLDSGGVPTIKANKEISPGIQDVYEHLSAGKILFFPDSTALITQDDELREHGKPTSTLEEFGSYHWPSRKSVIRLEKNEKEIPVDSNDHGMDAMRYLIHTLFGEAIPDSRIVIGSKSGGRREAPRWTRFGVGLGQLPSGRDWSRT